MWTICWEDIYGERFWEIVGEEDTMNQRRSELSKSGIVEEIVVGKIIYLVVKKGISNEI